MPLIRENKFIYSNYLRSIGTINFGMQEIGVISCLIHNRGEKKIASLLFISPNTVKSHTQNIMRKLHCNSRETVIDIMERSGKLEHFKQYYTNLSILACFKKILIKIAETYNKDTLLLYITQKSNLDLAKIPVFQQLKQDLILAKITLLQEEPNIENSKNIIRVNVFLEPVSKQLTLVFDQYGIKKTIIFGEDNNYYFGVLELLAVIINPSNLAQLEEEFKKIIKVFQKLK